MSKTKLKEKAKQLRKTVLEMCVKAGTGHVTSCFSCVEIMVALFYEIMKPEDVFILSKGQASPLLYAILADKGLIEEEELWKFCTKEGKLGVHLDHHVNGAVVTSGSLGHGLGIGCGMALADKNRNVYVLLGDGECYEGSVWEAAMFAGMNYLPNLTAIIDHNGLMVTDWTGLVRPQEMFEKFAWHTIGALGHSLTDITRALNVKHVLPKIIEAHTIKGKGIPFMENKMEWHGDVPKGEDIQRAREALDE